MIGLVPLNIESLSGSVPEVIRFACCLSNKFLRLASHGTNLSFSISTEYV